jgi:hypothetical protein
LCVARLDALAHRLGGRGDLDPAVGGHARSRRAPHRRALRSTRGRSRCRGRAASAAS